MGLEAVPVSLKDSQEFVDRLHRHHKAPVRDKFRIGCALDGKLVGVANVGRPVSRILDDGHTVEVIRLCTDGTKNVCSFLYSRCARAAEELGYSKIITYILDSESGVSLQSSGWHKETDNSGGREWDCPSRPRIHGKYPIVKKQRWAKDLRNSGQPAMFPESDPADPQMNLFD